MKLIDLNSWKRKQHYNYFKDYDYPYLSICGNLDMTEFYNFIKQNNKPFFISFLFITTKVANDIEDFRYRIKNDNVVEYHTINPAFTIMSNEKVFSFCTSKYYPSYNKFLENTTKDINYTKNNIYINSDSDTDNQLYITSIPWISFTNLNHPMRTNPSDSIPRICWGKYFKENERIKIPLSVQIHHALMDGEHIGLYFSKVQEVLDNPSKFLI